MIYLRVWSGKEGIDCEEVNVEAPSLDASLVSPHDVPAILRSRSGLGVLHIIELVEVNTFKEGLVFADTTHRLEEADG